jgi:hypothetical protein
VIVCVWTRCEFRTFFRTLHVLPINFVRSPRLTFVLRLHALVRLIRRFSQSWLLGIRFVRRPGQSWLLGGSGSGGFWARSASGVAPG